MTVSTTTNRIAYTGNGSTTVFAFPNLFLENDDLKVYVANVLQTLTTDYSVTGATSASGGTVTFVTAPASSADVIILCDPDTLQSTKLPANGPFPSTSVERMADKLTLLAQRFLDRVGRAVRLSDGDSGTGSGMVLPIASLRAGKYMAFDVDGNPTASAGTGTDNSLRSDLTVAATGGSLVGWISDHVSAVATTLLRRLRREVWIDDFVTGGSGTSADPWTGWQTFTPKAKYKYFASPGYYSAATFPNFRKGGSRLIGAGTQATVFVHTGTGVVFTMDGGTGAAVAADYNNEFSDFMVKGNALTTYAFDLRNIHQVVMRNISVVDVASAGIRGRFCIGAAVENFVCDVNPGLSTFLPVSGIVMDTDGVNGGCNAWNVSNFNIRGCSGYGIDAVYAQACNFIGGQVESNNSGSVPAIQLRFRASSTANKVHGIYTNNRLLDDGIENEWEGVTASSLQLSNATRARVKGGKVDDFLADNTSNHCSVNDLVYTTSFTNSSANLTTGIGVRKSDGTYPQPVSLLQNLQGLRITGQIERNAQTLTASGNFTASSRALRLSHATVAITSTITGLTPVDGQDFSVLNTSASGTVSHTLKLPGSCTFDDTNNTVTLNARGEGVYGEWISSTRLLIWRETGTPAYSIT